MKTFFFFLPIGLFVLFSACEESDQNPNDCLTGSGATTTESRTVGPFFGIEAELVGNLYITQSTLQELTIISHPNVLQELKTEVVGNKLIIETDRCMGDIEKLDVYITVPGIESIVFSGVGNIVAENNWVLEDLSVIFSGVGDTHLSGNVDNFSYILSGIGQLDAFDLSTQNSSITISGNGDAKITVSDELNIVISGTGNVQYKGEPDISSTITGTGNVIDAN